VATLASKIRESISTGKRDAVRFRGSSLQLRGREGLVSRSWRGSVQMTYMDTYAVRREAAASGEQAKGYKVAAAMGLQIPIFRSRCNGWEGQETQENL
jgi:hypothetical protein